MGHDHPVSWCKDWQGGRSFYTALGNTAASFDEPELRTHLGGAITWAAGQLRPGLQRLRRDGPRQLPADQDLCAAEPQ